MCSKFKAVSASSPSFYAVDSRYSTQTNFESDSMGMSFGSFSESLKVRALKPLSVYYWSCFGFIHIFRSILWIDPLQLKVRECQTQDLKIPDSKFAKIKLKVPAYRLKEKTRKPALEAALRGVYTILILYGFCRDKLLLLLRR